MADVLLTHSYHLPFDRKQVRKMQPYPPLGTLYAAALLRRHGLSVALFDTMLNDPAGFEESLRLHRPKIVAIYEDAFNFLTKMCLTRMRGVAFNMIDQANAAGAVVITHGSDATDHVVDYLKRGSDYVLIGEAEITLLHLSQALLAAARPQSIPGIAFLDAHGNVRRSAPRAPLAHPNDLPAPARDLIDTDQYRRAWQSAHGYFSMNAISSRGCPFRCNWCAKPIFGDAFHIRRAAEVADELCTLQDDYAADHVWFADDIFALNRHWIQDFALEVERRSLLLPFKIQARADLMTRETVTALARAGCHEVWMGVESGSQRVLNAMDKGLLIEEAIAARANLRNAGIRACYFLQLGYPGEQWQEIQETVRLVRETQPDDIGVSLSYPLPNTRFYDRVREQLGPKHNWKDSDDLCVMFKGAYTDDFYRSVRDALHAEVETWTRTQTAPPAASTVSLMWQRVAELEPLSRNADATQLSPQRDQQSACAPVAFVPARQLTARGGD